MPATLEQVGQIGPVVDYVFDNTGQLAQRRYRELSALYDAQTVRHLEQRGIAKGWSCLEIGGGGGSIAAWLSAAVGDNGRVLATDLDPRFLHALSLKNLEVQCHDIRVDDLPERQFDLAHARLVLIHLPERDVALERIVASLKPGGWIVIEEFDGLSVTADSSVNPGEEELKALPAFYQVLLARGVEMRYGRWLPQKLRSCGLVNVGAEASVSLWRGDSPGTSLFKLNFEELCDEIVGSGLISEAELEADLRRLEERDLLMLSPLMWTVWGQVLGEAKVSVDTSWSVL